MASHIKILQDQRGQFLSCIGFSCIFHGFPVVFKGLCSLSLFLSCITCQLIHLCQLVFVDLVIPYLFCDPLQFPRFFCIKDLCTKLCQFPRIPKPFPGFCQCRAVKFPVFLSPALLLYLYKGSQLICKKFHFFYSPCSADSCKVYQAFHPF